MTLNRKTLSLLALAGLTTALAACAPPPPLPTPAPPMAPFGLVPDSARRVAVGVPPLSFAAASTGPVYVIDESAMSLVTTISPPSNSGGIIAVDPTTKSVTLQDSAGIGGKTTLATPIDVSHKFSIWASPMRPATQP